MSDPAIESALPSILSRADNLPSLPAVAVEVLRLTESEDTTIDELADVIMRDPALTAKLLRLSNSAMFNRAGVEIVSMRQAAMALGLGTVRLMSLSFSLVESFRGSAPGPGFDLDRYWERSLCCAVAGQQLAVLAERRCGPEAFTTGLLAPIGQLVLSQCLSEEYAPVLAASGGRIPSARLERKLLGFDHSQVGHALLRAWELPRRLYEVVLYKNSPDQLPTDCDDATRELCHVVHVAELAARVLCDEEKGAALKGLAQKAQRHFQLPTNRVSEFITGLGSGIHAAADLLSIQAASQDYTAVLEKARAQVVQLSLTTAMNLQAAERRANHLEAHNKKLITDANTDPLTNIGNRRYFDAVLEEECQRRMKEKEKVPMALGVLMIDIDHFKAFNDTYGHQMGDRVLKSVGGVLEHYTRDSDYTARYGGEEFAVIAPETTIDGLRVLAERLRYRVSSLAVQDPETRQRLQVTVSIGAACVTHIRSLEDGSRLVKVADGFLYEAKHRGRNRCEFYAKTTLPETDPEPQGEGEGKGERDQPGD